MTSRPLVVVLFSAVLLAQSHGLAIGAFTAVMAADLDTSVPLIGQAIMFGLVAGGVVALFIGPLGDHYGHRRAILLGALMLAIASVLAASAQSYLAFFISRLPASIGTGVLQAMAVSIAATRIPPAERRWAIGWIVSAGALASIVVIPAAAVLADATSWRVSVLLIAVFSLLLGATFLWLVSPDSAPKSSRPRLAQVLSAYRPLLRDPVVRALQLSTFLRTLVWLGFLLYLGAFLVTVHGMSLSAVGYLYMWGGVWALAGTRLGDGRVRIMSLRALYIMSTFVLAVAVAVFLWLTAGLVTLLILLAVICLAGGAGVPSLTILLAEASREGQGATMMLRQIAMALGLAIGASTGGGLLALGGFPLMGAGLGLFAALAALVVLIPGWRPDLRESGASGDDP
jgi:MFS transporter, DHA1 family, inner membrane transport protein